MEVEEKGLGVVSSLLREVVVEFVVVVVPFGLGGEFSFVDGVLTLFLGSFKHVFGPLGSFSQGDLSKNFFVSHKGMFFVHVYLYIIHKI